MSLPKATVVSMPAEKPRPVGELVPMLLDMIEEGEIDLAVSKRHDLASLNLDPDASPDDGIRYARLSELLGVAKKLPVPVARALAAGIRDGNLVSVKPRLEVYAQTNYGRSVKARRALYRHAPMLAAAVSGWLMVPFTGSPQAPAYAGRSAGSAGGVISAVLMMGVAGSRCAGSSSHHEFSSPRFDLQPIKLMNEVQFDPTLYDRLGPHGSHSQGLRMAEIQLSAAKIMELGSMQQVDAANELALAASNSDCHAMSAASLHLDYASAPTVSRFSPAIADHLVAIHEHLTAVCPR